MANSFLRQPLNMYSHRTLRPHHYYLLLDFKDVGQFLWNLFSQFRAPFTDQLLLSK